MENLIKNNKDRFMAELPAGHQERFAMKCKAAGSQRGKYFWLGISSSVAAILLFLILINKKDFIQPYIYTYNENEKVAEMRMIYETQLNKTIELLENVLVNVDDSTRKEINIIIENLNHTSDAFADIAPLPEEKQLAITSYIYKNQLESLNSIYRKINNK